jgi:hypothetical protein
MAAETLTDAVTQDPLKAGIHIVSEAVLPLSGGSNLVKGDFKQAVAHAGLGLVARALLGPVGVLLVSLNSLSVALTEKPVTESLNLAGDDAPRTTRATPKA